MSHRVILPDPDTCRRCGARGKVINSRRYPGYRWRRRKCPSCGHRWPTYETILSAKRIRLRSTEPAEAEKSHNI